MRNRDLQQQEKFESYLNGVDKAASELSKLIDENERNEAQYSADQQQRLKRELGLVQVVLNCHQFQKIQAKDCIEDKEIVFKALFDIRQSIQPIVDEHSQRTVLHLWLKTLHGRIIFWASGFAALAGMSGVVSAFLTKAMGS